MLGSPLMNLALISGGGAANYAPFPAPSGYRWEFVYINGSDMVVNSSGPVVILRSY